MARYVFFIFFLLPALSDAQPEIKFEDKSLKFDKVEAGEILSFDFIFLNKGDQPLIISDIQVACDCTKPTWPREPVKPGAQDTIHVTFDTSGKIGWQDRILEIHSNSEKSPDKVRFKGVVKNDNF